MSADTKSLPPNVFENSQNAYEYLKKVGNTHYEVVIWKTKDGFNRWSVVRKPKKDLKR